MVYAASPGIAAMESEKSMEQRVSDLESEVKIIRATYTPNDALAKLELKVDTEFAAVRADIAKLDAKIESVRHELRVELQEGLRATSAELKAFFWKALLANNLAILGVVIAIQKLFP